MFCTRSLHIQLLIQIIYIILNCTRRSGCKQARQITQHAAPVQYTSRQIGPARSTVAAACSSSRKYGQQLAMQREQLSSGQHSSSSSRHGPQLQRCGHACQCHGHDKGAEEDKWSSHSRCEGTTGRQQPMNISRLCVLLCPACTSG